MNLGFRLSRPALLFALLSVSLRAAEAPAPAPGPFFEPDHPFFHSQVQLVAPPRGAEVGGNFVVRGIILPLASGHALVFDQELLRLAALWKIPEGQPPVTLMTMAQTSYANIRRKAASQHPQPTGPLLLSVGMHPGIAANAEALFADPRPPRSEGDEGRGALPADFARFDGIELAGMTAVLSYRSGGTAVREWHEGKDAAGETQVLRHFEVAAHSQPLQIAVGSAGAAAWELAGTRGATAPAGDGAVVRVASNSDAFSFSVRNGELIATLAPSAQPQRASLAVIFGAAAATESRVGPTPPLPAKTAARRWPQSVESPASAVQLGSAQQNGLVLDRISTPEANPWNRRLRVADLAFLDGNRAAVLTYDGDVWLLDGLADEALAKLSWRRFASGLHEPMAIVAPGGIVQVATKNGVVRLHDRDGNGEADWVENFNDHLIQSETSRSFPLDMGVGPDGSTVISQGGIVTRSGIASGGEGTVHTGGIMKISPDGRSSEMLATGAREPFLAVHPKTGVVTATDQQGNYIPSSVAYLVRPGDHFGFLEEKPAKLTPPLTWIPHDQDSSSSSQVWMLGEGMGPWNGKLLHLSYGTGRLFMISPDLDAPVPQAAVIPLELKTDLPLLHARMHPRGNAVYLAGFQIWGTRTTTTWALGRLRPGPTPIVTAIAARSTEHGVILEFAEPLQPESVQPAKVFARAWNYQRSRAYGSGRYTLDGGPGTTPWGVAQTVLSADRKSVFVHLPKLPPAMQLEVRHDFQLASGAAARGVAFFTINRHRAQDLAQAGFGRVDLTKVAAVALPEKEDPPTVAMGKAISESLGCIACHSIDGTTEGKIGPTWRRMFGVQRAFIDGTTDVVDEVYIREKILDPQQKKTKPGQIEMPSYRGVLSEVQIEAITLYIRSLSGRRAPTGE